MVFTWSGKTRCEKVAANLIKAYGSLMIAYTYTSMRYPIEALKYINIAVQQLNKSGIDQEDLQPILDRLSEIKDKKMPTWASASVSSGFMGAIVTSAQEELLKMIPRWIIVCAGGRLKD